MTSKIDIPIKKGYSFLQIDFLTIIGVNKQDAPKTNSKLQILDPTTFPIATLAFPPLIKVEIESETETASSGQLVPIATIVKPIINSEM